MNHFSVSYIKQYSVIAMLCPVGYPTIKGERVWLCSVWFSFGFGKSQVVKNWLQSLLCKPWGEGTALLTCLFLSPGCCEVRSQLALKLEFSRMCISALEGISVCQRRAESRELSAAVMRWRERRRGAQVIYWPEKITLTNDNVEEGQRGHRGCVSILFPDEIMCMLQCGSIMHNSSYPVSSSHGVNW